MAQAEQGLAQDEQGVDEHGTDERGTDERGMDERGIERDCGFESCQLEQGAHLEVEETRFAEEGSDDEGVEGRHGAADCSMSLQWAKVGSKEQFAYPLALV